MEGVRGPNEKYTFFSGIDKRVDVPFVQAPGTYNRHNMTSQNCVYNICILYT